MAQSNSDKKRLAKNTVLLYGRTIIVMFVSLYVSRLILNILGVTDYGVYNAVGGIVGMFSVISSSLVAATQRFITFELGKENGSPSYVFSLALILHLLIAFSIIILAETIGVWFLNNQMNLPEDRMIAANWVFQFSVLAFIIRIITVPYSAIVVAQEKMGMFAIITIVEVVLKLLFALVLLVAFTDKLIYYSISMAIVPVVLFLMYFLYCKKKFKECCEFKIERKIDAYRKMGEFIGWNFIGSTATVLSGQGVNVLLNIFCGVLVNAGRGVAAQVDHAVNSFINSFTTAIRPQIIKTFAAQEYKECFRLINQGTKMIMYLTLLFVIPLTLRTDYVLTIWLKTVPDYAVLFTQLSFLIITMDALSTPLYFLMLATGKIKVYQLVVGTLALLTFPFTWVALKLGLNPEMTYYILFGVDLCRWVFQLIFLKRIAKFVIKKYLTESVIPVLFVAVITIVIGVCANKLIPDSFLGLVILTILTTFVLGTAIITIGLTKNERITVINFVHSKIRK